MIFCYNTDPTPAPPLQGRGVSYALVAIYSSPFLGGCASFFHVVCGSYGKVFRFCRKFRICAATEKREKRGNEKTEAEIAIPLHRQNRDRASNEPKKFRAIPSGSGYELRLNQTNQRSLT